MPLAAADIMTGPSAKIVNKRGAGEVVSLEYWEAKRDEDGSPVESYSPDEARVVRDLFVDWRDRLRAARAFAGYARVLNDAPTNRNYISRMIPEPYRNAEAPWMWCNSVAPSRGFKKADPSDDDISQYTFARLTANYTNLRYRVRPDDDPLVLGLSGTPLAGLPDEARLNRFVSKTVRKASKILGIPTGQLFYVPAGSPPNTAPDPNSPVGESFSITEPRLAITYVHHVSPMVNWPAVWACQFCVNDSWWPDHATGFPPQTLLYEGPNVVERLCPFSSEYLFDVQHEFVFAPNIARQGLDKGTPRGWNWKIRVKDGLLDYYEVATAGGDRPFQGCFFGDLFRPPQP